MVQNEKFAAGISVFPSLADMNYYEWGRGGVEGGQKCPRCAKTPHREVASIPYAAENEWTMN